MSHYEVKEKIEYVDLIPTVKRIENWILTGNVEGNWYKPTHNKNKDNGQSK